VSGQKQCVITRIPDAKQIAVFGKWMAGSSVGLNAAMRGSVKCCAGRLLSFLFFQDRCNS